MATITDEILRYMSGLDQEGRQRFLGRLAQEAHSANQTQQEIIAARRSSYDALSVDELKGALARIRALPAVQRDMVVYDQLLDTLKAKEFAAAEAARPAPQPAPQYSGRSVSEIRADLSALQSRPSYQIESGKYDALVRELARASEAGAWEPAPPPAPPQPPYQDQDDDY